MVRSTASIALHVLRVLEDTLIKSSAHNITMRTRSEVALYILNQKRANLRDLEQRFGVSVTVIGDDSLTGTSYHSLERGEPATGLIDQIVRAEAPRALEPPPLEEEVFEEADDEEIEAEGASEDGEQGDVRRKRRRRRRRGRDRGDRETTGISANAPQPSDDALAVVAQFGSFPERRPEDVDAEAAPQGEREEGNGQKRDGRRRRSRRRGHGPFEAGAPSDSSPIEAESIESVAEGEDWPADAEVESLGGDLDTQAATDFRDTIVAGLAPHVAEQAAGLSTPLHEGHAETPTSPAAEAPTAETPSLAKPAEPAPQAPPPAPAVVDPNRPKKTGWWQRAKASIGG
jgi:ribonuclease E